MDLSVCILIGSVITLILMKVIEIIVYIVKENKNGYENTKI